MSGGSTMWESAEISFPPSMGMPRSAGQSLLLLEISSQVAVAAHRTQFRPGIDQWPPAPEALLERKCRRRIAGSMAL